MDRTDFIVDARYPISNLASTARADLVNACRKALAKDGAARLETFIRPAAVAEMAREVSDYAGQADTISLNQNPYMTEQDDSLPADHPAHRFTSWESLTLCRDRMPDDSSIACLFNRIDLLEFVRDCLGLKSLYQYRDPMVGYMVNIINDGGQIPWHFDTNDFSVSILLQVPGEGGVFEYAPNLRNPRFENLNGVSSVLDGGNNGVIGLPAKPGDLLIFKGRNSLHRVTEVQDQTPRYSAIFGYTDDPDIIGTASRRLRHFGRCHDVHQTYEASMRK